MGSIRTIKIPEVFQDLIASTKTTGTLFFTKHSSGLKRKLSKGAKLYKEI